MATACLGGLPAFISVATLVLNALGVEDFLSGMLLRVDDGVVDDDGFRQRTAGQVTQRDDPRARRHAGHIGRVRARRADTADVQDDHILGADQVVGQRERHSGIARQRRVVHNDLTSRLVERDARALVGRLRHSALRAGRVANFLTGIASGKFGVRVGDASGLRIGHDYDPIHEVVIPPAEYPLLGPRSTMASIRTVQSFAGVFSYFLCFFKGFKRAKKPVAAVYI